MYLKAFRHLINEFFPIVAFFITAQLFSFYVATATLIITTSIALGVGWFTEKRLPILPVISGFFVLISGLITIFYKAPDALIFGDSLYYLLMGTTILIGLFFKVFILKLIFGDTFAMHDLGWIILSRRWVLIFILAGIINEVARHTLTPEDWVQFKVLKIITIAIFGFYQFTLSRRYRLREHSNAWGIRIN